MENKSTGKEELFYKTVDRLEKQSKSSFRQNLVIVLSVLGLLAFLLYLGYSSINEKNVTIMKGVDDNLEYQEQIKIAKKVIGKIDTDSLGGLDKSDKKYIDQLIDTFNAQSLPKIKPSTLYVWSKVGQFLRDTTDYATSKKLRGYPYGTPIQIINSPADTVPFSISLIKKEGNLKEGFLLDGVWQKVRSADTVGYMFSGLLSPLPVFKSATSLDEYVKFLEFNPDSKKNFAKKNEQNEIVTRANFANISMTNGFLLLRNLYNFDDSLYTAKNPRMDISDDLWRFSTDNRIYQIENDTALNQVIVMVETIGEEVLTTADRRL